MSVPFWPRSRRFACLGVVLAWMLLPAVPPASADPAPGAPGGAATWTEADKDGYGTSATPASKVWHTLDDGRLTEVFYPDLGTPSVRTLELDRVGRRDLRPARQQRQRRAGSSCWTRAA